jgi:hypothetical protein
MLPGRGWGDVERKSPDRPLYPRVKLTQSVVPRHCASKPLRGSGGRQVGEAVNSWCEASIDGIRAGAQSMTMLSCGDG